MERFDFAIIGAGVVGAWVAFELSKCSDSVIVLERENDCCMGTSKANSAIIHAGYDPMPGSLMARLNVRGNEMVRELHEQMDIPFKQIGSLVAAFDEEGMNKVRELYDRGVANGVQGLEVLNAEGVRAIEPGIAGNCLGALYAPTAGISSSFELTTAPLEISILNGVVFRRNYNLAKVEQVEDEVFHKLVSDKGETIEARVVINAAGVHADEVARLAGDDSISINPRRGEYVLFDKSSGSFAKHVVFQPPTKKGKGILVTPTVDGNLMAGPNAHDTDDKSDVAITADGQAEVMVGGMRSIPQLEKKDIINSFAGLRAVTETGDFIIGFSKSVPWLFNIAGICSPGLSAAPAIGEYAADLIEKENLCDEQGTPILKGKELYADSRKVVRFMQLSEDEKSALIRKNPLYARVICRCESVTEGEIVDSILRPAGATDMDGVKRRTRAGMGRCQSGFCGPKVMEILARELGKDYTAITKFGRGSWMTIPSVKEVNPVAGSKTDNCASGSQMASEIKSEADSKIFEADSEIHVASDGSADIHVQVAVVGGGPAGLSAAYECWSCGIKDILIIERDYKLGGILNQCIHPGFGLHVFGEELTGPEYAQRYINKVKETSIRTMTDTMVLSVEPDKTVQVMNRTYGVMNIHADAVILAMGCRERTRGMLQIPGTRPAGIYTAGTAQRLINVEGYMPGKEVVILGSGDIGLIMARRMTLEGAHVKAVYEVMDHSGGLKRNIVQCLEDFGIPLYYSMTAVDIHGHDRVTGITVAKVDENMQPIPGTEEYVSCDTVLLSCGLIPENELTRGAGIEMDPKTRGPVDKGDFMTSIPGIFACGNVFKVYDLADNVTKDSILAGRAAAGYVTEGLKREEFSGGSDDISSDDTINGAADKTGGAL